jgi:YD repeat-containing protein
MKHFFTAMKGLTGKSRTALAAAAAFMLFFLGVSAAGAAYTVNYSYDKAGRLTKASYNKSEITYVYDATGNLVRIGRAFPWSMFLPAILTNATGSMPKVPLASRDKDFLP